MKSLVEIEGLAERLENSINHTMSKHEKIASTVHADFTIYTPGIGTL